MAKLVKVQALSGFKFEGRGVLGARLDDKGKLISGDTIEVPRDLASALVYEGKAVYAEGAPKAEKLTTKSASALVG